MKLISTELNQLNQLLSSTISSTINGSGNNLISEISSYIVFAGGKQIRPVILLLTTKMLLENINTTIVAKNKPQIINRSIKLATALELIHTATLIHDDIVDNSTTRRKKPSAHLKWGQANTVTAGDWLFASAFELIAASENFEICQIIATMTKQLAAEEIKQLNLKATTDININNYLEIIEGKTALLFAIASQIPACLIDLNSSLVNHARLYGLNIGMAFQIVDDILDYTGSSEELGKNIGDDLLEGKTTLPLIFLRQQDAEYYKSVIYNIKKNNTKNIIKKLKTKLCELDCINKSYQVANQYIVQAKSHLTHFPDNQFKNQLMNIAESISARKN